VRGGDACQEHGQMLELFLGPFFTFLCAAKMVRFTSGKHLHPSLIFVSKMEPYCTRSAKLPSFLPKINWSTLELLHKFKNTSVLSATIFGIMTFGIMTLSQAMLSTMALKRMTLSLNDTYKNVARNDGI
jgi:hypothetical protein